MSSTPGIEYRVGDATDPEDRPVVIAHVCNDIGAWGAGFVVPLGRRWPRAEAQYLDWHRSGENFELGRVAVVKVGDDVWVANMIAQHGIRRRRGDIPLRYDALATCLEKLAGRALELGAVVAMPRIGAGLAGGDWAKVSELIEERLCGRGVKVVVYDLPRTRSENTPPKL